MPRTHGYAPRGQRCYGKQAWEARGRTNAIGALLGSCLLTVRLFQNNIDTPTFKAWLLQDLLPKLPACSVIVMNNASFHKTLPIKTIMEASGHTLEYLPPYILLSISGLKLRPCIELFPALLMSSSSALFYNHFIGISL
jgi:hypothetical protein